MFCEEPLIDLIGIPVVGSKLEQMFVLQLKSYRIFRNIINLFSHIGIIVLIDCLDVLFCFATNFHQKCKLLFLYKTYILVDVLI